jgi:hypothetical protein
VRQGRRGSVSLWFVVAVVVVSNVIAVAVNIIEATVLRDKALFLCATGFRQT